MEIGRVADGSPITLTTTREIDAGESLTICYVDHTWPGGHSYLSSLLPLSHTYALTSHSLCSVEERRSTLLLQHGFVCACQRCRMESAMAAAASRRNDLEI